METRETLLNLFKKGSEIMRATSPGPEYEGPLFMMRGPDWALKDTWDSDGAVRADRGTAHS